MNGPEIDWVKLIGLALGGIGTALGIYNAWAACQAMKPKLKISWLNCRQSCITFSDWEVDQAKQLIVGSLPEGLQPSPPGILETLPRWVGSLKERCVEADIIFHNVGGRDIVISDIQIDDWVFGRGPYGSRIDWAIGSVFRAIDPATGQEVDLSSATTIPPHRSVTRRIETYEKHCTGPEGVGRHAFPVPPPGDYLVVRVLTDSQPPLVVKRIPLEQVHDLFRPEWVEPRRPRLTIHTPIIVRGSLPIVSSLISTIVAEDPYYEVVFEPVDLPDWNTSGAYVRLVGEVYHTPRGEPPRRDRIGGIDLHQLADDTCYMSLNLQGFQQHRDALQGFGWTVWRELDKLDLVDRLA